MTEHKRGQNQLRKSQSCDNTKAIPMTSRNDDVNTREFREVSREIAASPDVLTNVGSSRKRERVQDDETSGVKVSQVPQQINNATPG